MGNSHSVTIRRGPFRGFTVTVDRYRGADEGIRYTLTAEAPDAFPRTSADGPAPVVRFATRAGADGYEVAAAALEGGTADIEAALSWLIGHIEGPAGAGRPNCAALIASAARARRAFHARGGYAVDSAPFVVVTSDAAPAPAPADVDGWAEVLHADPVPPLVVLPAYAPALMPHVVPAGIDPGALEVMTAEVAAAWNADAYGQTTSERIDALHAVWIAALTRHGYAPVGADDRGGQCRRCRVGAVSANGVCRGCARKLAAALAGNQLATACTSAEAARAAEALRAEGFRVTVRPVKLARA